MDESVPHQEPDIGPNKRRQVRERILDAYQDLLLQESERSATIAAIAQRARVSKGGLLYHFPSKNALSDALIQRLDDLVAQDVQQLREDPRGPAIAYIETSTLTSSALDAALSSVAKIAQTNYLPARAALIRARQQWLNVVQEQISDASLSQLVVLLGDGIYYNMLLKQDTEHPDLEIPRLEMSGIVQIVTQLVRAATDVPPR